MSLTEHFSPSIAFLKWHLVPFFTIFLFFADLQSSCAAGCSDAPENNSSRGTAATDDAALMLHQHSSIRAA